MSKPIVPVPSVVDELIEWDNLEEGLTEHQVDKKTHDIYTICFVPRGEDTPIKRTIRRHEFLHAVFDRDTKQRKKFVNIRDRDTMADVAVSDAFVQLVYWPAGKDPKADEEAVLMGFADLQRLVKDIVPGKNWRADWDEPATLMITLRSMAIIKLLGSDADKMNASAMILRYYTPQILSELTAILGLVRKGMRGVAERRFAELGDSVTKQYHPDRD